LSPVISSMADRWCTAKSSMSYVGFHLVVTSRGILHSGNSSMLSVRNHKGKKSVVKWRIAKATFRNYEKIQVSPTLNSGRKIKADLDQYQLNWLYVFL
jgi:hypothetical protein